ncbi:MAG TPA: DUF1801 domain-containing protein [Membranihabitans sp.]|nr:DUF1801 domain-containing protein [Membranihabitans sp.]
MQIKAENPQDYINQVPENQKEAIIQLRKVIQDNIPDGFQETMNYGMIGYVVPHSIFPDGYHCDPKLPLPFASIAAQKNFVAVYHMGVYANPELYQWFVSEHQKRVKTKLDMGKSCIRYKKPENIPYDLIAELFSKMTVEDWVNLYTTQIRASSKR